MQNAAMKKPHKSTRTSKVSGARVLPDRALSSISGGYNGVATSNDTSVNFPALKGESKDAFDASVNFPTVKVD